MQSANISPSFHKATLYRSFIARLVRKFYGNYIFNCLLKLPTYNTNMFELITNNPCVVVPAFCHLCHKFKSGSISPGYANKILMHTVRIILTVQMIHKVQHGHFYKTIFRYKYGNFYLIFFRVFYRLSSEVVNKILLSDNYKIILNFGILGIDLNYMLKKYFWCFFSTHYHYFLLFYSHIPIYATSGTWQGHKCHFIDIGTAWSEIAIFLGL